MKLSDTILILMIFCVIGYYFLFPNVVTDVKTEYIKGDTVYVTTTKTIKDTVYLYSYKTNIDTLIEHDTILVKYSSDFNLGDSTLGTSGKVSFDMETFDFSNINYRYPSTIKKVTDTLKVTNTVTKPLYKDEWFYSTIALAVILIQYLIK